jgi:hypothetical protein
MNIDSYGVYGFVQKLEPGARKYVVSTYLPLDHLPPPRVAQHAGPSRLAWPVDQRQNRQATQILPTHHHFCHGHQVANLFIYSISFNLFQP